MFQRTPARNLRILRIAVGLTITGFLVCYAMTFLADKTRQIFLKTKYIDPYADPSLFANTPERLKAAIVILVRNSELEQLLLTVKQFEDRWNKKYNYPYVYLNDVPFTEEFIEKTSAMTKAKTYHATIPKDMWSYPSWINQTKAEKTRVQMELDDVPYGGLESYYHMCRFNSGFFFRHPLLDEYDYYWRVEPGVDFYCNIDYDPFAFIQKNNITYGFTIALKEIPKSIPTLWKTVKKFIKKYPQYVSPDNSAKFISDNNMETYNLCHFWSNFEIGDLRFYRSEAYLKFFEYLDNYGGFYYERWGDAPVHSIAAALFLDKSRIHFFNDIGYKHGDFGHCPPEQKVRKSGKCQCDPKTNFDGFQDSCLNQYFSSYI